MTRTKLLLALAIALAGTPGQAAQLQPTSDLLLPWFEVDLEPAGATTLFAVGNALDQPVDVLATVNTNWGIPILQIPFTLQPGEIRTVNLRDWLRDGAPGRKVAALELEHLAAAASGRPSPKDKLYYSSEVLPGRAVGSVTLRTRGSKPDALWGDWFVVDIGGSLARGDVLVDIDPSSDHRGICRRHLLRYLSGGGFDGGTELVIWRETAGRPSASPEGAVTAAGAYAAALSEPGLQIEDRHLALLPLETVSIVELGLSEPFGALRIETGDETFIGVRHSAEHRYSVALQAHCLASSCDEKQAGLTLEVLLQGKPVATPPGLLVEDGSELAWTLVVANTGQASLGGIMIAGLAASCPRGELGAGELMVCTAASKALSNQQSVQVEATGRSDCASASAVSAIAVGHYQGALVDVGTFP
ncbi:MAG TPA: hypothetical protein VN493_15825 [Thermoanaerobaculia bacterium]|nr:hypothetical protein [Thermoanaerobaculia bacterium]